VEVTTAHHSTHVSGEYNPERIWMAKRSNPEEQFFEE